MSTSGYTPRAGSAVFQVIEHLKEHGGSLDATQISELTGADITNVATQMRKATEAHFLNCARASGTDSRKYIWTLGPRALADAGEQAPPEAASALSIVTFDDGDVHVSGYAEAEGGGALFTRAQIQQLVVRMTRPHVALPELQPLPGRA